MTFVPPCQRPENDPDDWFIEKDGRQYSDDDLTDEEIQANLVKRRHAKDMCWVECIGRARLGCLDHALTTRPEYGTHGGYYPEELRKILRELDARRSRVRA